VAQNVLLIGGLCHAADFGQMWPKMCPSWRTLSHSRLQPNVAQSVPFVGGLCHTADFNQMWPKMCPLLEDFVTQWTSTKYGPNTCPSLEDFVMQRTLTICGPTVPLIGGLCHAMDFDQMWPKVCISSEDFVLQRTLIKCGQKCAPHWRTLSHSGL
jgi:hypothetical protein